MIATKGSSCRLADLFLHSPADPDGNAQPIDVYPVNGTPRSYKAVMDYGMQGFNIEAFAVPRHTCKVGLMTKSTTMVDPGASVNAEVVVKAVRDEDGNIGGDTASYSVHVRRLQGSETEVQALDIAHAYLVPSWDPFVKNYSVSLDVHEDVVRFTFQRRDNGQAVSLASEPESPGGGGGRRLSEVDPIWDDLGPPIGEVQHSPSTLLTTLDVGHERTITLVVHSADQSKVGKYEFFVRRPFCPQERRFFDGQKRICTDVCNQGFFGSHATGRCSACLQPHCVACESGAACSLCLEGFELQGGQCFGGGRASSPRGIGNVQSKVQNYGQRHRILVLAGVSFTTIALCTCTVLVWLAQSSRGRLTRPRLLGGDDEELSGDAYYEDSYYDD